MCPLQTSENNMSELEKGMVSIIQIFHKYSGHKCKLKKVELKDLINNDMGTFIKVSRTSTQTLECLGRRLEKNNI